MRRPPNEGAGPQVAPREPAGNKRQAFESSARHAAPHVPVPERAPQNAVVSALHAESDLWAYLRHQPWTVVVVEHGADVAALAAIGVHAVALSDPCWPTALREHRDVLVIGSARRLRRDILRAGPRCVYYRPSLPGQVVQHAFCKSPVGA